MTLLILSVFGALLISGLCSLMEATLLSLRPGQIAEMATRRPRIAGIWQRLKANVERPIAAILILNTAAHTIGASMAGAKFNDVFGEEWIWVFSLIFTFLMLQFTEILPKGIGVNYNRIVAVWIAGPLSLLVRVMRPIEVLVHFINRPFGPVRPQAHLLNSLEEISSLTGFARLSGEISAELEAILKRGTRLSRSKVRDVMRPRVDIDAVDVNTPPDEVLGAITMSGFSRVPVYGDDLDDIQGFVYIKDVLLELHMGRPLQLSKLLRPTLFVPETLRLDQLVKQFRQQRTQMAVVLDEHGGTEGLVTLEDVLEEIVGTIHDEHRREDAEIEEDGENCWLVTGATSLDNLFEVVGRTELKAAAPPSISTVGGLVQAKLDRVATVGDTAAFGDLSFEVMQMEGMRIDRVRVCRKPQDPPDDTASERREPGAGADS